MATATFSERTATKTHFSMGRRPKDPDLTTYRGRFAARLRELRQEKFATQAEFVEALGNAHLTVTLNAVSTWERGSNVPEFELLPTIAAVLGTTVPKLMPPR